jgi:hypothetical protein
MSGITPEALAASVTPELMRTLTAESRRAYAAWSESDEHGPDFASPRDTLLRAELSADLYAVHAGAMRRYGAAIEARRDWELAELKRHLPMLAAVIQWALDHIDEARIPLGTCCGMGEAIAAD